MRSSRRAQRATPRSNRLIEAPTLRLPRRPLIELRGRIRRRKRPIGATKERTLRPRESLHRRPMAASRAMQRSPRVRTLIDRRRRRWSLRRRQRPMPPACRPPSARRCRRRATHLAQRRRRWTPLASVRRSLPLRRRPERRSVMRPSGAVRLRMVVEPRPRLHPPPNKRAFRDAMDPTPCPTHRPAARAKATASDRGRAAMASSEPPCRSSKRASSGHQRGRHRRRLR